MVDSATTWTVTAADLARTGSAAADQLGGHVRAAVLELAPHVADPDLLFVVQVGGQHGRLDPGLDEVGEPDPAATTAACGYLLGRLADAAGRS